MFKKLWRFKKKLNEFDDRSLEPLLWLGMAILSIFVVGSFISAITSDTIDTTAATDYGETDGFVGFTFNYGEEAQEETPVRLDDLGQLEETVPAGSKVVMAELVVRTKASLAQRLVQWFFTAGPVIMLIAILHVTRLIGATRPEPFTAQNSRRLQWLTGFLLVAMALTTFAGVAEMLIERQLGFPNPDSETSSSGYFLAIIVLGFLTRVWKRGVELNDDRKLTI